MLEKQNEEKVVYVSKDIPIPKKEETKEERLNRYITELSEYISEEKAPREYLKKIPDIDEMFDVYESYVDYVIKLNAKNIEVSNRQSLLYLKDQIEQILRI